MNKKGQEIPGWGYVVGLIIGLALLIFLIWFMVKGGQFSVSQILGLK